MYCSQLQCYRANILVGDRTRDSYALPQSQLYQEFQTNRWQSFADAVLISARRLRLSCSNWLLTLLHDTDHFMLHSAYIMLVSNNELCMMFEPYLQCSNAEKNDRIRWIVLIGKTGLLSMAGQWAGVVTNCRRQRIHEQKAACAKFA